MVKIVGGDISYILPNVKVFTSKSPKVKYHPILSLLQKTKLYRIKTDYGEKIVESKPCHIKWNDTSIAYLTDNYTMNVSTVFDGKYTIEELSLGKNENLVEKLIATNKKDK